MPIVVVLLYEMSCIHCEPYIVTEGLKDLNMVRDVKSSPSKHEKFKTCKLHSKVLVLYVLMFALDGMALNVYDVRCGKEIS